VKIGVLSFAHMHAYSYASQLATLPGVELVVADEEPGRAEEIAGRIAVRVLGTYDDVFEWGPDAVVVTNENAHHRQLVERAAAAGCHVLCEKPIATNLADARAMIEACERAGVRLMTAFPIRFSPAMRSLDEMVKGGTLGQVLACTGTNQGSMPGLNRPWFVDPALSGGGAMIDHTVHVADLLGWMLAVPAVEVYAQSNRICYADEVEVETGGLVAVTFEDGTVATIDCSWNRPTSYPTWGGLTLEMVGTGGTASADAFKQIVAEYSDVVGRASWLPWGADMDRAMVDEFRAAIVEGRQPQPDGEAGYRALEIALGALRSAATGQPVKLPLMPD
jgi:predicted dehydrogenase